MRSTVVWGAFLIALGGAACKKPQLRSDRSGEPESDPIVAEESGDDYRSLREKVIGQRFETLTLGSLRFANAEVRDITDTEITIEHDGGIDKVPWHQVSDDVREEWGYNPATQSIFSKITEMLPTKDETPEAVKTEKKLPREPEVPEKPKVDPQQLAQSIDRQQKMLESQLVGIRNIESNLAQHSARLAELRNKLQALEAQKKRARSGGIVVERINGKSRRVGSGNEAAEVRGKVQIEEQLVAQLTKSLQTARQQYLEMKRELDRLQSQF